jgi:ABC-type transport system involved in multi-copper enzyme maturation permease subunit
LAPSIHVARKELLDHLLSLKFHVSVVAMIVLLGLSAYVMYGDYQLRMANYSVMRDRAQARAGEEGVMVVVEPRPLSVFVKGLDELMTRGYTLTPYLGIEAHGRQRPQLAALSLFTAPDLLYIVKALLSLIALLFAYDSVSGERESGTLKLMLSSAVSRGQVVAGKMLGGLAALLLPFLAALAVVLLAVATRPGIRLDSADYGRLAAMAAAAILYAAFFFALGVLVSALARSSATALMLLLFCWALLVFAVPNVGNLAAEQIAPLPSAQVVEARRVQEFAKNRFLDIQSEGKNPAGGLPAFNREYDRLVEDYRSRLDAQIETSKSICRISPAATLSYLFTDLAGTGLSEQRRLTRALIDYKNRNLDRIGRQKGDRPPAFEFRPAGVAEAFARGALGDFAVLALLSAAAFAAAVTAFLRTDPR